MLGLAMSAARVPCLFATRFESAMNACDANNSKWTTDAVEPKIAIMGLVILRRLMSQCIQLVYVVMKCKLSKISALLVELVCFLVPFFRHRSSRMYNASC